MIYYYLAGLISVLIATQSRLLFWPAIPVLFAAAWKESPGQVLTLGFLTGLFLDLFIGNPLGKSAIFLLLACGLVYLLKSRFGNNWRIFFVTLIFSQIVFYVANY